MKEISNCPSTLAEGFRAYSPRAAKILFDGRKVSHILDFDIDGFRNIPDLTDSIRRISVSGVQEKFPAVIERGKIRLARKDERSTHILKPAPWDETLHERRQIPANEHVTMQIASQVYGITTAPNGLCFTTSGRPVYITKRFDIQPGGIKLQMEDFASVTGKIEAIAGPDFKYSGCYLDIAQAILLNATAWRVDTERFFELVLFNYIYANGDDHLKNFSLIRRGEYYRLAPAYDLINTSLHVRGDDFGLNGGLAPDIEKSDVYVRTGHPCRLDFERFGKRISIPGPRLRRILDKYMEIPESAKGLVARSFLSDKMKRTYIRIITERAARFKRN